MNMNHIISGGVVAACCCVSIVQAEEVGAPTLCKGAVITLTGGEQLLNGRQMPLYRRQFGRAPQPVNLTLKIGETVRVGNAECWLSDCGLNPASAAGVEVTEVYCIQFLTDRNRAELVVDIGKDSGKTSPRYFLRRVTDRTDDVKRGVGIGNGAQIQFLRRRGNTWYGTVSGYLYDVDVTRGFICEFNNTPITVTLPAEGEDWSRISESDTTPGPQLADSDDNSAEQQPAAEPLTHEALQSIFQKRLQLMVKNPVDEALMRELYTENVIRLSDNKIVSRRKLQDTTRNLVQSWPRRGVKLLSIAGKDNIYELLVVFSYSNHEGREIAGYSKISLLLDAQGKICGMREDITPQKGHHSAGFTPFSYTGKKEFITVE